MFFGRMIIISSICFSISPRGPKHPSCNTGIVIFNITSSIRIGTMHLYSYSFFRIKQQLRAGKSCCSIVTTESIVAAIKVDNFLNFLFCINTTSSSRLILFYPSNYHSKLYKYINRQLSTISFVIIQQIQSNFPHFIV